MASDGNISEVDEPPSSEIAGHNGPAIEIDIILDDGVALPSSHSLDAIELYIARLLASPELGFLRDATGDLAVRLCDDNTIQALNRDYRGKDKPTNVLSFPGTEPDDLEDAISFSRSGPPLMLGDIIMSVETCARESAAAGKDTWDHMRHLLLHGLLHLLGWDHIEDDEADEMEGLEVAILARHAIANPYA